VGIGDNGTADSSSGETAAVDGFGPGDDEPITLD
jgi:hypothetical protein